MFAVTSPMMWCSIWALNGQCNGSDWWSVDAANINIALQWMCGSVARKDATMLVVDVPMDSMLFSIIKILAIQLLFICGCLMCGAIHVIVTWGNLQLLKRKYWWRNWEGSCSAEIYWPVTKWVASQTCKLGCELTQPIGDSDDKLTGYQSCIRLLALH